MEKICRYCIQQILVKLANCQMQELSIFRIHMHRPVQQWKPHSILQIGKNSDPSRETPTIAIKLKLLTGTYIFEKNRARYISKSSSICKLCDKEVEGIEHFLLSCPILNSTRLRYYSRLDHLTELLYNESFSTLTNIKKTPYIIKPLCNTLCIIACST